MATSEPEPTIEPTLDAYRFHEREWEGDEELREAFEWTVPGRFNVAGYVCDRWAEADPDRVALRLVDADGGATEHTYGDLERRANRLAGFLESRGVGRGDRVAVSGAQHPACVAAHLAAWKLGAVSVPLSLRFGPDALRYRLADSGASAFVAAGPSLEALRAVEDDLASLSTVIATGDAPPGGHEIPLADAVRDRPDAFETATTDAADPAAILYTSGTTGPPKGVVLPHRALLGVLPSHVLCARNLNLREDDLIYTPAEWSWVGPLFQGVLASLYYGTPVLADAEPRFDPERTFDLLDRHGVSAIGGATTVYRLMMQVPDPAERYDLSSLRVVLGAGEPLGETVVDWWRDLVPDVAVHEAYGQTETGIVVGDCEALGVAHEPGRMGEAVPGCEVRVVDPESGEPVEDGTVGELAVRRTGYPGCLTEYWNAPEKTAVKVRDDWVHTEDLGSRDDVGYYAFHSRADDVIVSAGYRIGPAEIEESLSAHEAVANAGVIGVPDDTRGEVPKAFVVLAEGSDPSRDLEAELQAHVKDRLAKHEYPRELEFLAELPKTTTGKVRRHDLRKREGLID